MPPPNEFARAARQLQLPYADEDFNFDGINLELLVEVGQSCRDVGLIFMKTLEIPTASKISQICSYAADRGAVPEASGTAWARIAKTILGSLNIGYFVEIVLIAGLATLLCWEINGLLRGQPKYMGSCCLELLSRGRNMIQWPLSTRLLRRDAILSEDDTTDLLVSLFDGLSL
ncbi:hypothetical protein BDR22DRAFT_821445 [Usnea florida]